MPLYPHEDDILHVLKIPKCVIIGNNTDLIAEPEFIVRGFGRRMSIVGRLKDIAVSLMFYNTLSPDSGLRFVLLGITDSAVIFRHFEFSPHLAVVIVVICRFLFANQTCKIIDLSGRLVALCTRHNGDRLRVLVGDMSDQDAIRIQRLRASVSRDLNLSINVFGNFEVQDEIVTRCLVSGIACGRIIVDIVQDTGDGRVLDFDIILEIRYVLAEQIFSRVDVSVGDKRQVGFPVTSSSSAIADLTRTLAPEIRVSISCL